MFGKARGYINWLEFWVYMCVNGDEVAETSYMADADDENVLAR
jgi:hypothetical protein